MDKVLEPFFSTRTEEGLRGLGLSIVQDIVKVHGGQMEIRSSPEAGTTVVLYLPLPEGKNLDEALQQRPSSRL